MATASFDLTKSDLNDLVEHETRALDVVASWESLCDCYRVLEFSDQITDATRLEEYKWIIKEMNKFLTRIRNKLITCKDAEAMVTVLMESFTPSGKVNIESRKALAFQKLRQRWIYGMIPEIQRMQEESEDGWTDGYDG